MFDCQQKQRNNCQVFFVKNYHPSAIKLSISASGQRQSRPVWIEFCTIKGCGARVRRGGKAAHVDNNQSRHYSLLLQEKKDILWRVSEVVSSASGRT